MPKVAVRLHPRAGEDSGCKFKGGIGAVSQDCVAANPAKVNIVKTVEAKRHVN